MKKVKRKVKLFDLTADAFERRDPVAFELRERLLREGVNAEADAIEFINDDEARKVAKIEAVKRRAKAHEAAREKRNFA